MLGRTLRLWLQVLKDPTGQKPKWTGHPFSAARQLRHEPSDTNLGHQGLCYSVLSTFCARCCSVCQGASLHTQTPRPLAS